MRPRAFVVVCAIAVYSYLVYLFFKFKDDSDVAELPRLKLVVQDDSCNWCIRLCCQNETTCNETFARENLENVLNGRTYDTSRQRLTTIKLNQIEEIFLGEPNCTLKSVDMESNFTFLSVSWR